MWTHRARALDAACNRLLLAGGDANDMVDVAALEVLQLDEAPRYLRLPGDEPGVSRHHSVMALDPDPDSRHLLLFGGWRGEDDGHPHPLDDTWLYRLSPSGP